MRSHVLNCLCLLLLVPASTQIHASPPPESDARPRIGLALSGGGARGAAHIGVLRELERLKIPVDYIAGTSMGAVVGGLYAAGMSADEIETLLTGIDWLETFNDIPARGHLSFRRKQDDRQYLVKRKPGIGLDGLKLPGGLIQGQKIDMLLSRLTLPVASTKDFSRLPIPFRAVAADISSGEAVVLAHGNLALALRASMSIPGVFAPVDWDGRLLVDGGLANNLPVDVARDMGAERVIAVNVSTPLAGKLQLNSLFAVSEQLTTLLTHSNTRRQLDSLGAKDILIEPHLDEIGTLSFADAGAAVARGEQAAHTALRTRAELSLGDEQYALHRRTHTRSAVATREIDFLELRNDSAVDDTALKARISHQTGGVLDVARLENDIARIYGLDLFQNVRYELHTEGERTGLFIDARKKSWGPDYLQFGIAIADNFAGDNSINASIAYTRTAINQLGGEWRSALQVGEDAALSSEWYQPLDSHGRWFFGARAFADKRNTGLFKDGKKLAEYRIGRIGASLRLGRNAGSWGRLQAGLRWANGDAEARVGDPGLGGYGFDIGEAFVGVAVDTLDNLYLPRSGSLARIEYLVSRAGLGARDDYEQLTTSLSGARSWGAHTLLAGVRFDTTLNDDAPLHALHRGGGFTQLSGLDQNELSGQHFGVARLGYLRRIEDLYLLPAYIGASLEVGNAWNTREDISWANSRLAASLFLGVDTLIGPIFTGYGIAEGGKDSLYLFIGKLF